MSRTRGKREAGSGGWRRGGDPFEEENRPRKTKKPSSGGGKKAAVIVLCCIAALAVGVAVWWTVFVKPPAVKENNKPGVTNNNPSVKPGEPGKEDPADGEAQVSGRKEDYYTFLLVGRDTAGGGNTDTLILVSYDVPNGQVNMMSIPRDTAVNVPWSIKKVNSVYNAKESSGGGMEGLKQHVAYLTGVMPDRYVIIEWKAVGRVVDAVGGVEFDVPRNMNYDDPLQDLHIHFNKGLQKLDGKKAMAMLRYRNDNGYTAGYNDIGRMNTQRDFLKAMAKRVLQLGNITKIGEFIDIFMENVETDLTLTEMMWFASKALSVDVDSMQSSTLPYIDVGHYRGGDYLLPNGPEIVPLVNELVNPYNREVELDDLRIIVRNSDGSCSVPGGELADAKWAKAVRSSEGTEGGGISTTKPTGVIANPNVSTGNSSSGGGKTEEKPSSGGGTAEPPEPTLPDQNADQAPGETQEPDVNEVPDASQDPGVSTEPGGTDVPDTIPDPDTGNQPGDVPQDPAVTEPEPGPEPVDPGTVTDQPDLPEQPGEEPPAPVLPEE